jgi:hypothetical protein
MKQVKDIKRVTVGLKFRYNHADSNPLWVVRQSIGRGVWLAEVIESEDWLGTQKSFLSSDILRSTGIENLFARLHNEHDEFYAKLKPGQIIHYNNGFKNFVRCKVVKKDGQNVLLPIALVGEWREYDLPHRREDTGELMLGYHGKMIVNGETFNPNASNLYEFNPSSSSHRGFDPTGCEPLELTVDDITPEQEACAALWKLVYKVEETIRADDTRSNPGEILKRIAKVVSNGYVES